MVIITNKICWKLFWATSSCAELHLKEVSWITCLLCSVTPCFKYAHHIFFIWLIRAMHTSGKVVNICTYTFWIISFLCTIFKFTQGITVLWFTIFLLHTEKWARRIYRWSMKSIQLFWLKITSILQQANYYSNHNVWETDVC